MSKKNSTINDIIVKKRQLEKELKATEDLIYEKETDYLNDFQHCGNWVKGWDYNYLTSMHPGTYKQQMKAPDLYSRKSQSGKVPNEDRIFSKCSKTAPLEEEFNDFPFQAPPIKMETESKNGAKVSSRRSKKRASKR